MSDSPDGWPYRHSIRIRYQEIDMQRVVFNAHYLAYCDEVMAGWVEDVFGWTVVEGQIDWMLVKLVMEWQGSATYGDTLDIDCGVIRWGETSFDVAFRGTVADRPVFKSTITYVCVTPGTTTKMSVPAAVRTTLGLATAV